MLYELAAAPTTLLVDFLKGHEAVETLAGEMVSSYKIDTPAARIQLAMLPGDLGSPGFEIYQYQVDCWGPTDAVDDIDQAEQLARTVCNAIPDLIGTSGVTTAYPTVRPFSLPDPETGRARFVCQIQFQISPEA